MFLTPTAPSPYLRAAVGQGAWAEVEDFGSADGHTGRGFSLGYPEGMAGVPRRTNADGVAVFAWSLLEEAGLLPTVYEAPGFPGDSEGAPAGARDQNPAASPSPRGSAAP